MTAYELLTLGVEAYLRELDEAEFTALTRRVRPPKQQRYPVKSKRANTSGPAT